MILPDPNNEILLNDLEYNLGVHLGYKRFEACENHKVINRKMASRKTNKEISEIGALSEIAFCKMMNLYPDLSYHPRKGSADCSVNGLNIDVKVTKVDNGQLLVTPKKEIDGGIDLFVLLIGLGRKFTYKGWMYARDIFNDKNMTDLGYGPTYAIPQENLYTRKRVI